MEPVTLADQIAWLESHINYERFGPGGQVSKGTSDVPFDTDPERRLRHVRRLLELMDDPHRSYRSIHITGTNGKTSTSRLITDLFLAHGLTVGTFTSPHLEAVNERISVNAEPISDDDLTELLHAVRLIEPMLGEDSVTYFEILTAAGLRHFADSAVEIGVVEVGVGGTWDSTNVIDGDVAVITNIGLDHQNYLGDTLEKIATQKAGIIKPESRVVLGDVDRSLQQIFGDRPSRGVISLGSEVEVTGNELAVGGRLISLRTPFAHYDDIFLSLHGSHQAANAATAVAAVEQFFEKALPTDVVRDALGSASSPGRLEVVGRSPLVVVDGAHNVHGAEVLVRSLEEEFPAKPGERVLVVAMLSPHDPHELMTVLSQIKPRLVVTTQVDWPRAIPASDLASVAKDLGLPAVSIAEVAGAYDEAIAAAGEDGSVVVTGSLYLVGDVKKRLSDEG